MGRQAATPAELERVSATRYAVMRRLLSASQFEAAKKEALALVATAQTLQSSARVRASEAASSAKLSPTLLTVCVGGGVALALCAAGKLRDEEVLAAEWLNVCLHLSEVWPLSRDLPDTERDAQASGACLALEKGVQALAQAGLLRAVGSCIQCLSVLSPPRASATLKTLPIGSFRVLGPWEGSQSLLAGLAPARGAQEAEFRAWEVSASGLVHLLQELLSSEGMLDSFLQDFVQAEDSPQGASNASSARAVLVAVALGALAASLADAGAGKKSRRAGSWMGDAKLMNILARPRTSPDSSACLFFSLARCTALVSLRRSVLSWPSLEGGAARPTAPAFLRACMEALSATPALAQRLAELAEGNQPSSAAVWAHCAVASAGAAAALTAELGRQAEGENAWGERDEACIIGMTQALLGWAPLGSTSVATLPPPHAPPPLSPLPRAELAWLASSAFNAAVRLHGARRFVPGVPLFALAAAASWESLAQAPPEEASRALADAAKKLGALGDALLRSEAHGFDVAKPIVAAGVWSLAGVAERSGATHADANAFPWRSLLGVLARCCGAAAAAGAEGGMQAPTPAVPAAPRRTRGAARAKRGVLERVQESAVACERRDPEAPFALSPRSVSSQPPSAMAAPATALMGALTLAFPSSAALCATTVAAVTEDALAASAATVQSSLSGHDGAAAAEVALALAFASLPAHRPRAAALRARWALQCCAVGLLAGDAAAEALGGAGRELEAALSKGQRGGAGRSRPGAAEEPNPTLRASFLLLGCVRAAAALVAAGQVAGECGRRGLEALKKASLALGLEAGVHDGREPAPRRLQTLVLAPEALLGGEEAGRWEGVVRGAAQAVEAWERGAGDGPLSHSPLALRLGETLRDMLRVQGVDALLRRLSELLGAECEAIDREKAYWSAEGASVESERLLEERLPLCPRNCHLPSALALAAEASAADEAARKTLRHAASLATLAQRWLAAGHAAKAAQAALQARRLTRPWLAAGSGRAPGLCASGAFWDPSAPRTCVGAPGWWAGAACGLRAAGTLGAALLDLGLDEEAAAALREGCLLAASSGAAPAARWLGELARKVGRGGEGGESEGESKESGPLASVRRGHVGAVEAALAEAERLCASVGDERGKACRVWASGPGRAVSEPAVALLVWALAQSRELPGPHARAARALAALAGDAGAPWLATLLLHAALGAGASAQLLLASGMEGAGGEREQARQEPIILPERLLQALSNKTQTAKPPYSRSKRAPAPAAALLPFAEADLEASKVLTEVADALWRRGVASLAALAACRRRGSWLSATGGAAARRPGGGECFLVASLDTRPMGGTRSRVPLVAEVSCGDGPPALACAAAELAKLLEESARGVRAMPSDTLEEQRAWWEARLAADAHVAALVRGVERALGPWRGLLRAGCVEEVEEVECGVEKKSEESDGEERHLLLHACRMLARGNLTTDEAGALAEALLAQLPANASSAPSSEALRRALLATSKTPPWAPPSPPHSPECTAPVRTPRVPPATVRKAISFADAPPGPRTATEAGGSLAAAFEGLSIRPGKAAAATPAKTPGRRSRLLLMAGATPAKSVSKGAAPRPRRAEARQESCADAECWPALLVCDGLLHAFPWEGLACLAGQPIYRMPSLALALHAARQHGKDARKDTARVLSGRANLEKDAVQPPSPPVINPLDAYYLLNPSGDLEGTQARFEARFGAYKSWEGVVGAPPLSQELAQALESRQLFVYMGHGGGEQYLPPSRLRQLRCRASAMLMGCSSGRLWARPEEPSLVGGGLLAYMVAGCPGAVANLWDVTDKDIDRFAEACLDVWMGARGGRRGIAAVAREARGACRLKHLNGLAPVCYGLPMRVEGRVRE